MIEKTADDGGSFHEPKSRSCKLIFISPRKKRGLPDFRKCRFRRLPRLNIAYRHHRSRNTSCPIIAPPLIRLPLMTSLLQPQLMSLWIEALKLRNRRSKIRNFSTYIYHAMRPNILIPKQSLRRDKFRLHIHMPRIRVPGQLPIEMETAE